MTRAQDEGCVRVSEWPVGMIMRKVTSDDPIYRGEQSREQDRARALKCIDDEDVEPR